jgi:hypothetical protein
MKPTHIASSSCVTHVSELAVVLPWAAFEELGRDLAIKNKVAVVELDAYS